MSGYNKAYNTEKVKQMLEGAVLEVLVCPSCKGKLVYDREQQELICRFDKLAYAISQDIPMMLTDQARKLDV